jgi:hypothetical protein
MADLTTGDKDALVIARARMQSCPVIAARQAAGL